MTMEYYWMSCLDHHRPIGQKFLGGLVIKATSFENAFDQACAVGLYPGGEVLGGLLPRGVPYEIWADQLMDKGQSRIFVAWVKARCPNAQQQPAQVICQDCAEERLK